MKCLSCGQEFLSPAGDIVPICSRCIAGKTSIRPEKTPGRESDSSRKSFQNFEETNRLAALFPELDFIEQIGAGGMGAVFKARQTGLDRLVAIKVLNSNLAGDPEFEERFRREAKAMAKLNHPNIVAVYDFGHRETLHYLTMELVEGNDLQELLSDGELDRNMAFSIIEQICAALHYAHKNGVVHRDVKPGNILIDKNGLAKIGDFGLARIVQSEEDVSLTMTNVGMGTPSFMAPEQMTDAKSIDARADIFALGVVTYVMFTGHLPTGNFPPPTSRFPRPDKKLDELILRAMDPDPGNRFADVRELSRTLPKDSTHETTGNASLSRKRLSLLVFLGIAVSVVTLLGLGLVFFRPSGRGEHSSAGHSQTNYTPKIDDLMPKLGLPPSDRFDQQRRQGGRLRMWSTNPGVLDISSAEGVDDLVSVSEAPVVAKSWYAARRDGEMISSNPAYDQRRDYRLLNHSFSIEWPDRLVPAPTGTNRNLPLLERTKRAVFVTQQPSAAYILTPERKISFAAKTDWIKTHQFLINRLKPLNDIVSVDAEPKVFVALRENGEVIASTEGKGFFNPPEDPRRIVQAAAGLFHAVGLYEDGEVAVWRHPQSKHSRLEASFVIPNDLSPAVRVMTIDFVVAVQHQDGSWTAWGDDWGSGLVDTINSLGVALDITGFHISETEGAKLVWIESSFNTLESSDP